MLPAILKNAQGLRKITVANVMQNVPYKEHITDRDAEPADLLIVWGYVDSYRTEDSIFKNAKGEAQEYQRYFGGFNAIRLFDKKPFTGSQLILDNFSDDTLKREVDKVHKTNENARVEFAYCIGIEPFVRGSETKYRHTLKPFNMDTGEIEDPMLEITNKMLENMPDEFKQYFELASGPAIEHKPAKEKAKA